MAEQGAGPGVNPDILYERLVEYRRLARVAAEQYAGKDWHKLSQKECYIVKMLETWGYLSVNIPANGFVGKAINQADTNTTQKQLASAAG